MSAGGQSFYQDSLKIFSRVVAVLAVASGFSALVGWELDSVALKSVFAGFATMKVNTALAFILCGMALWLFNSPVHKQNGVRVGLVGGCAAVVTLIGVFTIGEYFFGWNPGIDQFLFRDTATAPPLHPGRPAFATALNFSLLGGAFLLMEVDTRVSRYFAQGMGLIVFSIGFLALMGYAYHVSALYYVPAYSSMALHTAILFVLLSLALPCARPERGWIEMVTEEGPCGTLLRLLLPAVVLGPPIIGGVWLAWERAGLYQSRFGLALFATSNMLIFSAMVWFAAYSIRNVEEERKRAEQQLKVSFKEVCDLKTALDEHAIVAITDPQGKITFVNDKFCAISKYSREELLGQDHRIINSAYHPKEFIRDLWTTIGHGRVWHGEIKNKAKDGSYYWVDTTIVPFLTADGKPYQYVAIRADITERKQQAEALLHANEALERSNVELQQFAYIASHDLQTPLRNISGFLQLLKSHYGGKLDEKADHWIRRSIQSSQQLHALIKDILAYSRVDSRAQPFKPVSLREVFNDSVGLLEASIRDAGGEVTCDELPTVMGDRSQLVQLMQNLIGNGLKFHGPKPPRVHASARRNGDDWVVCVRDNGIGVGPKHHERIFEIFKRLHTREEYPGTGIGLAVCRRVVHRHGGKIWVESETDHGSVFKFTIPERKVERP
jgi:PAS domain S-box-containing protein